MLIRIFILMNNSQAKIIIEKGMADQENQGVTLLTLTTILAMLYAHKIGKYSKQQVNQQGSNCYSCFSLKEFMFSMALD